MTRKQAIFWLLTIPDGRPDKYEPPKSLSELPSGVVWIVGQKESGKLDGYLHWQICCAFSKKTSRKGVKRVFGECHCEPSRSEHAAAYCQKTETAIAETQFEFGCKPFRRNVSRKSVD